MDQDKTYYRFSEYLKNKFGEKVFKVSVNAGFTCPNRDGVKGYGGCVFCDNKGFSHNAQITNIPIQTQIKNGIRAARNRYKAKKYIVYFQTHTNTYGEYDTLKRKYDVIKEFENVVGISIGTRPDCIDNNILDLIESYSEKYEVWIEYGIQSIFNKTLKKINRNHTYEDFLNAYHLTRKRKNIKICGHVIIGLPDETDEEILQMAEEMGKLRLDGIKIHPLHVIKDTKLEELFLKGEYQTIDSKWYINIVSKFIEYLYPGTVIQRISADCMKQFLVAPEWLNDKNQLLHDIDDMLITENRYQGRLYKNTDIKEYAL